MAVEIVGDIGIMYGLIAVGAGLATGLAGIGAGVGEQGIGAAVVGVVAEEPGFLGKGLFLMLLPETLIIFGLAVSLILMFAWKLIRHPERGREEWH